MLMPGRKYAASGLYKYGFNGKENDNEVTGEGNQQDYGMRVYDLRIGKFLSVDPISIEYPELTPYQFAGNTPIQAIDLDGLEPFYYFQDPKGNWKPMQAGDGPLQRKVPPEHRKFLPTASPVEIDKQDISTFLDFVPVIGQVKGAYESATGKDLVTGEEISDFDRTFGVIPYLGKLRKANAVLKVEKAVTTTKKAENVINNTTKAKNTVERLKETGLKKVKTNTSQKGFIVQGQLAQIFSDKKLFANWLKGNQSLSRIKNPLDIDEAQQIINNAKRVGLKVESNLKGLQGLEKTGQWGGIPHFKIGNIHIPIKEGLHKTLKF